MPKILIVSLTAGAGHIRTADALQKTAEIYYPKFNVKHINASDYISYPLRRIYSDIYDFLVTDFPSGWKFLYEQTNKEKTIKYVDLITKKLKQINALKFYKFIKEFNPDHIICTHYFPAELVRHTPQKYKTYSKFSILITDYIAHKMWLVPGAESYFVPSKDVAEELNKFGISRNKIIVSGIPIDQNFFESKNTKKLFQKYNLRDQKTILILSGGQGVVKADELVKEIIKSKDAFNIIVVSGKNEGLKKKIDSIKCPKNICLLSLGWTEKIDELMRLAHLVITKPGGLTTTECLFLNKPMLLVNPIPGQEEGNAEYIEKNKLGIRCQNLADINFFLTKLKKQIKKTGLRPVNSGKIILDKIFYLGS